MHVIIDLNCLSSSYLTFVRTIASRTSKLSYKRSPWFRVDLCNQWEYMSHGRARMSTETRKFNLLARMLAEI